MKFLAFLIVICSPIFGMGFGPNDAHDFGPNFGQIMTENFLPNGGLMTLGICSPNLTPVMSENFGPNDGPNDDLKTNLYLLDISGNDELMTTLRSPHDSSGVMSRHCRAVIRENDARDISTRVTPIMSAAIFGIEITPEIVTMVVTAILAVVGWGIRKIGLEKQLTEEIINAVHRVKDKSLPAILKAKSPDSPGGATITPEEMSQLRQDAYDLLKSELKGPLVRLLLAKSEQLVKGYIGRAFFAQGVKVG